MSKRKPDKRAGIDWDAQPLGERWDGALARELGVSAKTIGWERAKRGIPLYTEKKECIICGEIFTTSRIYQRYCSKICYTKMAHVKRITPLVMQDEDLMRSIAIYNSEMDFFIKSIKWDDQPLGILPDAKIARKLGVEDSLVREQRTQKGISTYRNNWDEQSFGILSDVEIARKLNVDRATVRKQRTKRNIPAYKRAS